MKTGKKGYSKQTKKEKKIDRQIKKIREQKYICHTKNESCHEDNGMIEYMTDEART